MNRWAALGLVLLGTQCLASFEPPREITFNFADLDVLPGAPQGFKDGDIGVNDKFQDASDAPLKSFWETLKEEATEFHEANEADLGEFSWSLARNGADKGDFGNGEILTSNLAFDAIGDLDDLFVDALSAEERINFGAVGRWIKTKAKQLGSTAKAIFVKSGGKKLLEQGLNLIKALKVRIDPLSCAKLSCGSCIYIDVPPLNGHKPCIRFGFLEEKKIGAQLRLGERTLFEQSIGLSLNSLCIPLPFPIGSACFQALQVKKTGKDMGFCMVIAIKQFKVGGQFCTKLEDGHLKPSFKAMTLPVEEHSNSLFVMDEEENVEEVAPVVDVGTLDSEGETVTEDSEEASKTSQR